MIPNKFNEKDKEQFVEFLNFIATKAEFKLGTQEIIKFFKLLSHMQQGLLPKIDANILEVKSIVHAPQEPESKPNKGKK